MTESFLTSHMFQDKVEEVKNDRYAPEEDKGKVSH